jgi:hypothetical protein
MGGDTTANELSGTNNEYPSRAFKTRAEASAHVRNNPNYEQPKHNDGLHEGKYHVIKKEHAETERKHHKNEVSKKAEETKNSINEALEKMKSGNYKKETPKSDDFKFTHSGESKAKYGDKELNGHKWTSSDKGIHSFQRKESDRNSKDYGKYSNIEVGEHQIHNVDADFMTKHGLTLGSEEKKKIQDQYNKQHKE